MKSRRSFLALAGMVPVALAATRGLAADAPADACYDPAKLTLSQRNRHRAIGYVDRSTDAVKRCELCAFFTGTSAGCGTCQLLAGAPVNGGGLCTSFAAKAAK